MNRIRPIFVTFLMACVLLVAAAPAAADVPARNETVHVFNSSGVPLADVSIYDRTMQQVLATTDGSGTTHIQVQENCWDFGGDTVPEDQQCGYPNQYDGITAVRDPYDSGDPCTSGPENWPGVYFPVGGWGYGNINVVLPTVPGTPYQPALSNEERGLLGVINQARAADGMAPLAFSTSLTASADKYLSKVPARKLDYSQDALYCQGSGPGIRAADAGFPTSEEIGESVLQGDGNAAAALADLQVDPRQDALDDPNASLIGIAQNGGTWVLDTSDLQSNTPFYARAGDTGDVGDAALVAAEFPPPPTSPSDPDGSQTPGKAKVPRDPGMKISRVTLDDLKVRVLLSLNASARGKIRVVAVSDHSKKDRVVLRVERHGSTVTASGRLHAGHWRLRAHFEPIAQTVWESTDVGRELTVHKARRQRG